MSLLCRCSHWRCNFLASSNLSCTPARHDVLYNSILYWKGFREIALCFVSPPSSHWFWNIPLIPYHTKPRGLLFHDKPQNGCPHLTLFNLLLPCEPLQTCYQTMPKTLSTTNKKSYYPEFVIKLINDLNDTTWRGGAAVLFSHVVRRVPGSIPKLRVFKKKSPSSPSGKSMWRNYY